MHIQFITDDKTLEGRVQKLIKSLRFHNLPNLVSYSPGPLGLCLLVKLFNTLSYITEDLNIFFWFGADTTTSTNRIYHLCYRMEEKTFFPNFFLLRLIRLVEPGDY